MAQMAPDVKGQQGLARRFHGLIASHWGSQNSPFCGPRAIYRNVEGEIGAQKVLEVQDDLIEMGKIIRGE